MPIQPPKCMLCGGAHWSTQPCPAKPESDRARIFAGAVHDALKQAVEKIPAKPASKPKRKPRGKK